MRDATFYRSNWRFLSFAFSLTFFSSLGQSYFIGVFGEPILATFGISHGDYGLLYMVATLASAALLGTVGRAIDVLDLRLFTAIVCGGVVGACFLMSGATTLVLLVVGLFVLRFTGQGLMGHTAFTSMGRYFDAGRGRAIAVAGLGFSAGHAVFPPLGVFLLAGMTWYEVWRILGIGAAVVMVPLSLWLLRGHADRHRTWQQRTQRPTRPSEVPDASVDEDGPRQWTRGQVLRDARFYLLVPALVSPPFLLTGLFIHQGFVADSKGWSREWLASWFVGFSIAGAVTTLLVGPIVDRWGARRMLQLYLIPLLLSLAVLALFDHPAAAAAFLVLAGVNMGIAAPTIGSIWAELYGVLHLGAIRALTSALMVVSTALAPPALGLLIDAGWTASNLAAAGVAYAGAGVVLIAVAMRRPG